MFPDRVYSTTLLGDCNKSENSFFVRLNCKIKIAIDTVKCFLFIKYIFIYILNQYEQEFDGYLYLIELVSLTVASLSTAVTVMIVSPRGSDSGIAIE